METTKHFGDHLRKHHKNQKMQLITSLTINVQLYTKVHVIRLLRPKFYHAYFFYDFFKSGQSVSTFSKLVYMAKKPKTKFPLYCYDVHFAHLRCYEQSSSVFLTQFLIIISTFNSYTGINEQLKEKSMNLPRRLV